MVFIKVGFRVCVQGSGFRVRVLGSGFGVQGSGSEFGVQHSEFKLLLPFEVVSVTAMLKLDSEPRTPTKNSEP
jgi:hypothetical protein